MEGGDITSTAAGWAVPSEEPWRHQNGSVGRLWADMLVRPAAEVLRPLLLREVAVRHPAGEIHGMVWPCVPFEDRTSPQGCDQNRLAVTGERRLRDDLRSHHTGEQLTGAAVP